MPRMKRELEFTELRVQQEDHAWLVLQKRGSMEQLDVVLHRILMEYRNSELAELQELYQEQIKVTQRWMAKYYEASERLKSINKTLDGVVYESNGIVDESKNMDVDEVEKVETS